MRHCARLAAAVAGVAGLGISLGGPSVALAVCERRDVSAFPNENFSRQGRTLCFAASNADSSTGVLFTDLRGTPSAMTSDPQRCRGGTRHGQPCRSGDDCPGGACSTPSLRECEATANGRSVFFIFNGNPTGNNGDLGDELFAYNVKKRTLTQVTNQGAWCSDDVSKACTMNSDCTPGSSCQRAQTSDLHVAPNGKEVAFVSTGDAGNNAGHGSVLYALISGKRGGLRRVGDAGGRFCAASTAKRDQACTKDEDCGGICGDGLLDPGEQCDPDASPNGCSQGQRCIRGGAANQCTCQAIACGDGFRDPSAGEECESNDDCSEGETCRAPGTPGQCRCVEAAKPSCGNGVKDPGEECDNTPCPPFQQCEPPTSMNKCTCRPVMPGGPNCGNGALNIGEECDGTGFPCLPSFQCDSSCQCVPDPAKFCGNNVLDPGEECDGTNLGACPPGAMCMGNCRCGD